MFFFCPEGFLWYTFACILFSSLIFAGNSFAYGPLNEMHFWQQLVILYCISFLLQVFACTELSWSGSAPGVIYQNLCLVYLCTYDSDDDDAQDIERSGSYQQPKYLEGNIEKDRAKNICSEMRAKRSWHETQTASKKIEGRCLTWIEKARYHIENPIYAEERDVSQWRKSLLLTKYYTLAREKDQTKVSLHPRLEPRTCIPYGVNKIAESFISDLVKPPFETPPPHIAVLQYRL